VKFTNKADAARAIRMLHGRQVWADAHAPLSVEPMIPTAPLMTVHEDDSQSSVFFAKIPPCVPASELWEVFSTCGKVVKVNLFKQGSNTKISKVGSLLGRGT
jgi:hypothetical protein